MWPVWVFRLFSLSVTQTQSISPPTKMQLVFGVCSGTATGGRDKSCVPGPWAHVRTSRAPGETVVEKATEGMGWAGEGRRDVPSHRWGGEASPPET